MSEELPARLYRAQARAKAIADTRTTEIKITTATSVVMKNLDMIESEAHIKLFTLARLFCLYLVDELHHLPAHKVRQQAFALFRRTLLDVMEKAKQVQSKGEPQ